MNKSEEEYTSTMPWEEPIIASFHTALEVPNEFFAKQQYMTTDDLMPVFRELNAKCNGIIKEPGIYAFKLQIVR